MGNYSYLTIGDRDIISWKYQLPPVNNPLLNFIFLSSDKKVEINQELKDEDGIIEYGCRYETTVSEVKKRFNESHFTIEEIDNVISEVTYISKDKIDDAMMDFEVFNAMYLDDLVDSDDEDEYDTLYNQKLEYDFKINNSQLETYRVIRFIRKILDSTSDHELVSLNFNEIISGEETPEGFADIELISEDLKSATRIDKKYLEMAKIHYAEYHFDLVYIELFIAVESALNAYLMAKSRQLSKEGERNVNLDEVFKNVKFIDKIKFCISFIGKQELNDSLITSIKVAYHVRNNKIHNNQNKFKRKDAIKAIEDIEELINIINKLD
ncbi:hypothetical protein HNV12_08845 [Methanococcoides sp. SA1]|nr:hypothetical protein [Methanococcoides sp. SA1]